MDAASPQGRFAKALEQVYSDSQNASGTPPIPISNQGRPLSLGLGGLSTEGTQAAIDIKQQQDAINSAMQTQALDIADAAMESMQGGSRSGYDTPYGLEPTFWSRLGQANSALKAAGLGTFTVSSGYRTRAQQAALYKQKPGLAAPPGKSKHELGMAVDINLTKKQLRWLQANAKRFGLYQPMSYEPWHWQPTK